MVRRPIAAAVLGLACSGDPRFNTEAIRSILPSVEAINGDKAAGHAEQFGEKNVGTFFERLDVAAKDPSTGLYDSLVVARSNRGRDVIEFNVDGNVNKILDASWPA